jgi:dihydropyrimidinase
MSFDTVVRGGVVLTSSGAFQADVGIVGERIAWVAGGLDAQGAETIDARGCFVLPGGVDAHTHLDMPLAGSSTADDFETGSLAALCGGTTTIVDYAAQASDGSLLRGLEEWRARAEGRCACDFSFHMTISSLGEGALREMALIAREGCPSFKVFMAYPGRMMLDDGAIFRVMLRAREVGAVVCLHAENGPLIEVLVRRALERGHRAPRYHPATRPMAAESEAAHRGVVLAEAAKAPLYLVHLSTGEAALEVRRARSRGLSVFGETCPQYLYLTEEAYGAPGFEGAKFVMSPPLRPASEPPRLWEALRKGWLQAVGTDHCSFNFRKGRGLSKRAGLEDFSRIPGGVPAVENRMLLLWEGVCRRRISARRFVEVASTGPARIFGLYPRKGSIAQGSDADIVILDPKRRTRVLARTHHMNVDYNPFEGMTLSGGIRDVLIRGRRAVRMFRPAAKPPQGTFLRRSAFDEG